MKTEEFLGYVALHARTERALFSVHHIARLYYLAGHNPPRLTTGFCSMFTDVAQPLVDAARENIERVQEMMDF